MTNTSSSGSNISGTQRASNDVQTPTLEKFGRDLTKLAAAGKLQPAIGRDKEIKTLSEALSRKTKSNAVLVGPFGVGKTAIVEQLAIAISEGDCSISLLNPFSPRRAGLLHFFRCSYRRHKTKGAV